MLRHYPRLHPAAGLGMIQTMKRAEIFLSNPDATADLAQMIAPLLNMGDVVLLHGNIGAGKSHFARALILSRLDAPEDIPSPTFTLVQTYDARGVEIWHADLYRLSAVDEVYELGLIDAFEEAICLIEWPDRLERAAPHSALNIEFTPNEDGSARYATLWASAPRWDALIDRVAAA
jgi:tRNA threonylcarbamoyladenosine biosynthesis protein TsaE